MKWSLISAIIILIPQILYDSDTYGRIVSAPFNIVRYNVFTEHGPDLYGTEPWSFYVYNGILNFNGAFLLAISVIPIQLIFNECSKSSNNTRTNGKLPSWIVHLSLHLWLLVFGLTPHKEERFLFPIYPLLCLAAASTLDVLQKTYVVLILRDKVENYFDRTRWISNCTLIIFGILSLSRVIALYENYHAPIGVWTYVANIPGTSSTTERNQFSVCVGKEWYRYPSSFFLPNTNWNLKYIQSEFKGR